MIKLFCKDNCWYRLSQIVLVAAMLTSLHVLYMLLWPQKIVEQDSPIKVEKPVVKLGQSQVLIFNFCKYKQYPSVVSFMLVDNTPFALRTIEGNLPLGCRKDMKYAIEIPETVEPGEYYIRQVVTYKINGLREDYYFYETEKFKVIK